PSNLPTKHAARGRVPFVIAITILAVALSTTGFLAATQGENKTAIIGVIQDDRGSPLANVKVTLASSDASTSTSTQADGKFEFHNLKSGQYRITVEAARFRKEAVNITLRPDEIFANPPIKLTPSSLHVAVLDASSQALAGVTLSLYAKERATVGALAARSSTDQYGDAYFGRLAPGSYQLSATLRGYDEYRNDVFISSGITTEFPLQLLVAPVIPINEKAVNRYTVPNLPSKNVRAVFQDSEGWMWFGTDKGLARFNGAEFKSSSEAGSPFERLAGEDIRAIAEDRSGTIWLAAGRSVRRISKGGSDVGTELDTPSARQVFVDSSGDVWVASGEGLLRFDGARLVQQAPEPPSADVRSIAEDKNGNIWIASASGVAVLA